MILVDSDVLIAHLRGVDSAREWLSTARARRGQLAISVLTTAEIFGGMRSGEQRQVAALLDVFRPYPVSDLVARDAGALRRRFRRSHAAIGLVDFLVAATARVHGMELATLNTKHFPMFEGLQPPFRL